MAPIQANKFPRKYFPIHTLCGVLIPPALAAYYLWTYIVWLRPSSNPAADIENAVPDGTYVWWSWFIIGAIGMNISNYTLGGVEAAMTMTERFAPKNAKQVIIHSGMPWCTLRSWKIVGFEIYSIVCCKEHKRQDLSHLWIILFGLSSLSWTFVLSGLTMVTYSGFKAGNKPGTDLVGINQISLNGRPAYGLLDSAIQRWGSGSSPTIPLSSALYVPPGSSIINTLPSDASSEIFLTPQTTVPITGKIWGVVLKYSCSGVDKLDEFTILNRRINSSNPAYVGPSMYTGSDVEYFYTLDDGSSISVLSQLWNGDDTTVPPINAIGFAEIGLSTGFGSLLQDTSSWGYTRTWSDTDFDTSVPTYSGLDDEEVLEFILWQTYWNPPGTDSGGFRRVQDPIPELENEYSEPYNPFPGSGYPWNGSMAAIGVRCTSSSVTGTATVNGLAGTFTDFVREDPLGGDVPPSVPRFSFGVPLIFLQLNQTNSEMLDNYGEFSLGEFPRFGNYSVNYTLVNTNFNWLQPLFEVTNEPHDLGPSDQQLTYYSSLIQTPDLQSAIIDAYQHYAIQLMFLGEDTLNDTWSNDNVTAAVPWTLLKAGGGVPPLLIVVTTLLWALGCAGLSIVYGFRKRWADMFDDYHMYCFCTERRDLALDPLEIIKTPR